MPFKAAFACLWCGTSHATRSTDDLEGWAQWSVDSDPQGGGACATFDQDVRVAARWSRAATLAPAVLRANHAWMMRQGRRGLARSLSRR